MPASAGPAGSYRADSDTHAVTPAATAAWIVAHRGVRLGQADAAYGGVPDKHHVWPTGEGGPDIAANRVVCDPDFHRACHVYLDLLRHFAGKVPWSVRRRFSGSRRGVPGVREIAELGYDRMTRRAM